LNFEFILNTSSKYPIVILSDGIPPYVMGGMQKHSRLLTEYLARKSMGVKLYHYIQGDDELPTEEEVRLNFSTAANVFIEIRTFRYPKEDSFPGHYLRSQRKMSKEYLAQIHKEDESPNLVYSKGFMGWQLLKNRDQLPSTMKIGINLHGMNMFQLQPNWKGEITKWMFRGLAHWVMNHSDYVFSYGGLISDLIRDRLDDSDKLVELPSGIDDLWLDALPRAEYQLGSDTLQFLFVGRWDRLKGLPELYEVLRKRVDLPLKLTIVGPIPKDKRIPDDRITYLGPIHNSDKLKKVYDNHDVLLCPSISEGMPNVIMEAMARGLAIIATNVGATAELVDEDVGWLIPPKNPLELEKTLSKALNSTDVGVKGNRAIEKMRLHFNWDSIADKFIEWYQHAITDDL
jgi:glycosyltransferase involved in cell wall biosynthesis